MLSEDYIAYVSTVRRYSQRTVAIYGNVLKEFMTFLGNPADVDIPSVVNVDSVRNYEVHLMEERSLDARTVNLHISVLSGFCRFLLKSGVLKSNPVKLINRPKQGQRLPTFYREESMKSYFEVTKYYSGQEAYCDFARLYDEWQSKGCLVGRKNSLYLETKNLYERRVGHLIISILSETGIRRSELISLRTDSVDYGRGVVIVRGKGDKMREIPLVPVLSEEISLYLQAKEVIMEIVSGPSSPLLTTFEGAALYPVYVDRTVKNELASAEGITGKRSPHVLRHTLATELLDDGADINSIKELLGHASLAATQVYTHNSIEKLKSVYLNAHPRAKNGGKDGD